MEKMSEHRYILEPYKGMNTRYRCPSCQQREKTFSLYIDTETGEHIHPTVGRCNRESNCGYHLTPKQYFETNKVFNYGAESRKANWKTGTDILCVKHTSSIAIDIFDKSRTSYDCNYFIQYLLSLFGKNVTIELLKKYPIGTSKYWKGATVFWQIDTQGKVRTGKIMLYSPTTGKRVKEPHNLIHWVHKAIKQPNFELKQCLFGEHLLIDKTKPVAIVESEKTAVIASVYLPAFIWVAVGSLTNLNAERCNVLKGRTVILFPDLKGFDKWSNKAKELSHIANFVTSDLLERKATDIERKQGLDLADYLIKFDYKDFIQAKPKATAPTPAVQTMVEVKAIKPPEPVCNFNRCENLAVNGSKWHKEIAELESYFSIITLPTQPVKLNSCGTITDCSKFMESHFETLKANNGKRTFLPYLNRLQELKQIITEKYN
jgi:hypothetical protein